MMHVHVDCELIRRQTLSKCRATLAQLSTCLESAKGEEAVKLVKSLDAAMEASSKIPPLHLGEYTYL